MQRRIAIVLGIALGAGVIFGAGFFGGLEYGLTQTRNIVITGISGMDPDDPDVDFAVFWEVWQTLKDSHLESANIEDKTLVYGAIKGLVDVFDDPYSEFFNPADSEKFEEDLNGIFGGVGMEIGIRDDQLTVIAPLKGTPAERAGLLPGDRILEVDGESTSGVDLQTAVKWIRGEPGTVVRLQILREGWDASREFLVTRELITVPILDVEVIDGSIAYIQLYSFADFARVLFYDAIREAGLGGAEVVILDLRNNPGGFLQVAVDLAGWFVERGTTVVSEEGPSGVRDPLRARGNEALKDVPTVVLINGGSASASEILAGALRDIRGVKLIGEKSFGKGTIQQVLELADGSSLKITVAHWVLPSGASVADGLTPDIEVERTTEDIEAGRDPQLDRAIVEIKKEIERARSLR